MSYLHFSCVISDVIASWKYYDYKIWSICDVNGLNHSEFSNIRNIIN